MKLILYVGATLMIGASIYGFVDYNKTSHKKEFTNMYKEEKKIIPVIIEEKKTEPVINNDIVVAEKKDIVQNDVKTVTKKTATVKKEKKKKKINARIFSRAPLREDMEEIGLPEAPKAEVKKTENKEQL